MPRFKHDVYLVAMASGPAPVAGFWRVPKPYQITDPTWRPLVIGSTGAIWIDADGDGRHGSPREYAEQIAKDASDAADLFKRLSDRDQATASQAASAWLAAGKSLTTPAATAALKQAAPHVQRGVSAYLRARRDSELARQSRE
ncbi:MAG: hypothetical protein N2C14_24785 [Planctomycetales bacterium]